MLDAYPIQDIVFVIATVTIFALGFIGGSAR